LEKDLAGPFRHFSSAKGLKHGASEKAGLFAASPRPVAPRKGSGFDWAVGFPLLSLPERKLGIGTLKWTVVGIQMLLEK
jgi:hypothetical protein